MLHVSCLFTVLIFFFNLNLQGQNLISNHSFEQYQSTAWNGVLTVDYLNPGQNQEGFVTVTDGNTCVGLRFWSPVADDWQEYIAQVISGKFTAGKTYKISFYYKLADRCVFSTDDLGVGFIHNWIGNPSMLAGFIDQIVEPLKNPENAILTNYNQYQQFSQYYTATGTETYLVIGCFKKDTDLTYVPISNPTSNPMPDIYFMIDEVEAYLCPTLPENLLEKTFIACDNQPFELNALVAADAFHWSTGSDSSSTIVSPDQNTIWLEAEFGKCAIRDTITIQRFSGPSELGSDILLCGSSDFPVKLQVEANFNETVSWSTGNTGPIAFIENAGNYSVTKSLGACFWSDTIAVIDLFDEIVLYPNPTSQEVHFKNESSISIQHITTEDGKKLILTPISIHELNLLIAELKPAIYFLDVELNDCFKRLKLCLI